MMKNAGQDDKRLIRFEASVQTAGDQTTLMLSDGASKELPSRGQVAVHGTFDGQSFETVIEPDGEFGHWMRIDPELARGGKLVVD